MSRKMIASLGAAIVLAFGATAASAEYLTIGETGYCYIWGPTSYGTNDGGSFSFAKNANWVNATCKFAVPDDDFAQALVFKDVACSIWFGEWPNETNYIGTGHATVSASGQVSIKCKAPVGP